MAERRMFAKTIIDSDAFLDMPLSAQALYFHLSMRADDDGFINKPKSIMRTCGCKDDDIKILFAKKFVIPFESGIVVIKHWKIHNYIRKDAYVETKYKEEKALLTLDENSAYRLDDGSHRDEPITGSLQVCDRVVTEPLQVRDGFVTESLQVRDSLLTQDRLGKDSAGKDNIESAQKREVRFAPPSLEDVKAYCSERHNTVDPERFIDFYESKGWYVGRNKMKDWKAAVRSWENRSRQKSAEYDNSFDPGASLQV